MRGGMTVWCFGSSIAAFGRHFPGVRGVQWCGSVADEAMPSRCGSLCWSRLNLPSLLQEPIQLFLKAGHAAFDAGHPLLKAGHAAFDAGHAAFDAGHPLLDAGLAFP